MFLDLHPGCGILAGLGLTRCVAHRRADASVVDAELPMAPHRSPEEPWKAKKTRDFFGKSWVFVVKKSQRFFWFWWIQKRTGEIGEFLENMLDKSYHFLSVVSFLLVCNSICSCDWILQECAARTLSPASATLGDGLSGTRLKGTKWCFVVFPPVVLVSHHQTVANVSTHDGIMWWGVLAFAFIQLSNWH